MIILDPWTKILKNKLRRKSFNAKSCFEFHTDITVENHKWLYCIVDNRNPDNYGVVKAGYSLSEKTAMTIVDDILVKDFNARLLTDEQFKKLNVME